MMMQDKVRKMSVAQNALSTKIEAPKLTRQILTFVALCLLIAEIVIFVPSASHFQYRWFEQQWQHSLVQFDLETETDLASLSASYERYASQSSMQFHTPIYIC